MRKIVVAGNWKMNKTLKEAQQLIDQINNAQASDNLHRVLIFPPFPYLTDLTARKRHDFIEFGAQNLSDQQGGAYTGEVSGSMLASLPVNYVLVGHSERRQYYGETNAILKEKIDRSLENGLTPIYCCGETLDEREADRHQEIVAGQLEEALFHLDADAFSKVMVAYEPVWAIGTGVTASVDQAEEMHAFIRSQLRQKYAQIADETHILYGGSCNASNSVDLFSCENVDGGLIGGASLKAEEFLTIISNVNG